MACYLGIDIGTHESKGVLVDHRGKILAMEVIGHDVDNPQPGWFSQDADIIWWGDFCRLSRWLMALGVDEETATQDACRMEHVISDTSFKAIKKHAGMEE